MAENKEITTLHPYMNRNKNRYPNVKDENIPDTIQRKLTAGQGINISPENVISATGGTGGDSYTRSETDALLDTKADKTALDNAEKVIPTDLAVKDGKIGLEHDTTWLTNQNAITLGDGLTYDEATKTLKVSGGGGGISVIELTDKNGTIASTQLGEINANPQNFAFKYNGKILLFTKADSTTYQYCNNTTSSSDNNVMTTSTLLTITSSTGVYTIAENVHNVVANSIHPANGGDLTNIQVGSKVYSIPTDLIATANKLSLGVGNTALGNGVNLDGFTYDEATKTLKASGGEGTPIHVYTIIINDSISYEVYTAKNYTTFTGAPMFVSDFATNSDYNELRTVGKYYSAFGALRIGSSSFIVNCIRIVEADYYLVIGYNLSNQETTSTSLSFISAQVIKQF